jgi:hypothetical protein
MRSTSAKQVYWRNPQLSIKASVFIATSLDGFIARANGRLLDEPQDPATMRFFLIRGLTTPAIFLLSIAISFFSVRTAIWTWFAMIAVDDALVIHRRFR